MISNIINKNLIKIIAYLVISPGSRYTRKEIKEKTSMNNTPLDDAIAKLKLLKIIKKEKSLYSINLESERTKSISELLKTEYSKYNLSYNNFIILLEILDKISKFSHIEDIILFGSYSKLVHTDRSDIDIAIISSNKLNNKIEAKIKKALNNLSEKEKKIIEPHLFTTKEIKENKSDPLIKDIIRNGKSLI